MIDTSVTHTNPLLNENEDELLEKLKMSSLTITEQETHTNTLLDETHTNSLLNKNKKLKKNNHKLIIETDDEIEKIENELSKKLIDISTSDIQDNTIKQLSEKGLKENNISNIYPEMNTHTYTPVNVTDVKVGDYIQYQYETKDRKTGDGVMTSKSVGLIEKITAKIIVIDKHQYKKEKLQNLELIKKIELDNVDEPETEIVPEIQTTYPETDMMSENNEMNGDKEDERCSGCGRHDDFCRCGDFDDGDDEEELHKEQLEAHGYATCERCEEDLPKGQIGDNGYCLACDGEDSDEDEDEVEEKEEYLCNNCGHIFKTADEYDGNCGEKECVYCDEDKEDSDEEESDEEECYEDEVDELKQQRAEIERKIREREAVKKQKQLEKTMKEKEKEFDLYTRDLNTLNKIREQYADKIRKYADKIGCPEWIINLGMNDEIDGNNLRDEDIEDFRQKHLEQMRKDFFKTEKKGGRGFQGGMRETCKGEPCEIVKIEEGKEWGISNQKFSVKDGHLHLNGNKYSVPECEAKMKEDKEFKNWLFDLCSKTNRKGNPRKRPSERTIHTYLVEGDVVN